MSIIVDATTPLFSVENTAGGLDIQGFEDQENRLNGTDGNDSIIGGDEDDILFGLEGHDTIEGLGGDDTLFGGAGVDTLIGGTGADTFLFDRDAALTSGEIDIIEDFNPDEDFLGIEGLQSGDNVDYDRDTGVLSLNGQAFAQIDPELPLEDDDLDFEDLVFDDSSITGSGSDGETDDGEGSGSSSSSSSEEDFSSEEIFSFDRETILNSDEVVVIEDFDPGIDTIQIEGSVSGDDVNYDSSSGNVSLNGDVFAQLDPNLSVSDEDYDLL